ncbi:hypothetical protein EDD85DRAFT_788489 [Armillaria nabsnona]|nr:hypothetical protein EDD85DRAFT_788489 [Armillaria nabsnona]
MQLKPTMEALGESLTPPSAYRNVTSLSLKYVATVHVVEVGAKRKNHNKKSGASDNDNDNNNISEATEIITHLQTLMVNAPSASVPCHVGMTIGDPVDPFTQHLPTHEDKRDGNLSMHYLTPHLQVLAPASALAQTNQEALQNLAHPPTSDFVMMFAPTTTSITPSCHHEKELLAPTLSHHTTSFITVTLSKLQPYSALSRRATPSYCMGTRILSLLGTCQIDKDNSHEWRSAECVGIGEAITNVTLELKP